jgi:outer membrane protein assembly factor BamB
MSTDRFFQRAAFVAGSLVIASVLSSCTSGGKPTSEVEEPTFTETDWPWWRGPDRDGIASSNQTPPLRWGESTNIVWRSPVPGRGHGSPTVYGEQIFLATADEEREVQSVLCYNRRSGEQLWKTDIHRGALDKEKEANKKASHASSSLACDGQRVFVNCISDGGAYTTALDLRGKLLWQTRISDYVIHLDRVTGQVVWRVARPKAPNYPSPAILRAAGREQLFFSGCDLVSSFDPLTGEKLWEVPGATTECVTTTVTDGELVFTTGGYPKNHVSAVRADGSGEIVWEQGVRVYVPSMLVHEGYLYAVTDAGIATCWKSATGEVAWKERLSGTFYASPVLVGDRIFATNLQGKTFIFKATPDTFELVGENELGNEVFATPTFCDSRIYMRVASLDDGQRQETLYSIAEAGR